MQSDKNNGYITVRPVYICDNTSLSELFLEWEIFQIEDTHNIERIYFVSNKSLSKCVSFIQKSGKYYRTRHSTKHNEVRVFFMSR
jgi:hypothetical protein